MGDESRPGSSAGSRDEVAASYEGGGLSVIVTVLDGFRENGDIGMRWKEAEDQDEASGRHAGGQSDIVGN